MNGMIKNGPGMYFIICIALIVAGVFALTGNHYKSHYRKAEPLSYQEAIDSPYLMAGYPAGEDIPVAKSIKDIRNNKYVTIEVSEENIEPTRVFRIKDKSESGDKSKKVGRHYTSSYVDESYILRFDLGGNLRYGIRQLAWNMENTSYGEWCVVTLESGERIYVLVDLKLLDIKEKEKIKLPIGTLQDHYNLGKPTNEYEFYEVEKENATWFVDMVGDWEDREVGDINVMMRFVIIFIILVPTFFYALYKYAEKKGY